MRSVNNLKYVFALAGAVMLIIALVSWAHTRSFLARATHTDGTVIRLDRVRTHDTTSNAPSSTYSYNYRPVVRFEYRGRQIVFASQTSSNPPAYSEGERVPVVYLESDLSTARIESFFSLYGLAAIAGGLGSLFFVIGAGLIVVQAKTRQTDERLREEGMPITTAFQSVEFNSSLEVNGRHPFKVVTQWQDPATSRVRVFESHNLWFDPAQFIKPKEITVYVDRANPSKYYMDLSFLPKLAG
jgi:hypothetical protein